MQLAVARAQVALDAAVLQSMPVAARHALDDRLIHVQAGVNSGTILYPKMWIAGEVEAMVEKASQRTKIRPPAAAGLFYAGQRQRLQTSVSELLGEGPQSANVLPQALIAPHAGYVYSGRVAAEASAAPPASAQSLRGVVPNRTPH